MLGLFVGGDDDVGAPVLPTGLLDGEEVGHLVVLPHGRLLLNLRHLLDLPLLLLDLYLVPITISCLTYLEPTTTSCLTCLNPSQICPTGPSGQCQQWYCNLY